MYPFCEFCEIKSDNEKYYKEIQKLKDENRRLKEENEILEEKKENYYKQLQDCIVKIKNQKDDIINKNLYIIRTHEFYTKEINEMREYSSDLRRKYLELKK